MNAPATWDPQQYLRHEDHRVRPFHDLLHRVPELPGRTPRVVDLGCGTGNVTALLAARWPGAHITGVDNSARMLERARPLAAATAGGGSLAFEQADIASWRPSRVHDLIVTNAALQWVPGHERLFPAWVEGLAQGGVLALQVPGQTASPSHVLLRELCGRAPWRERLGGIPRDHLTALGPADYFSHLADLGCEVDAWETTYYQPLTGEDPVLEWTKGTTLRPVLTALAGDRSATDAFLAQYRDALREAYPPGPHGTVFPFRRVFAVAVRRA